ncbi:hypothetical protein [Streptomyces sp. NPDC056660]|uniref:hypothetical protein n=1 Tax=Streptomyces sp. NPDC056660 TaxID=3345897 RepID=UPI00368AD00B
MTLTSLASESRLGDATGHRSPRRSASVLAMAGGAWLVLHHGRGARCCSRHWRQDSWRCSRRAGSDSAERSNPGGLPDPAA